MPKAGEYLCVFDDQGKGGTYEYLPILLTRAMTTAMTMTIAIKAPMTTPAIWPELIPAARQKKKTYFDKFYLLLYITDNQI